MENLRQNINNQISGMDAGCIFTYRDLDFPTGKLGNVTHILFEKNRTGELVRIEKGAYYKPKTSSLGLGIMPLYEQDKFKYITNKLGGYVTGLFAYNSMGLTEQVPSVITVATKKYTRPFIFQNLKIETVRSYVNIDDHQQDVALLRILDAIKDIKNIPARTQQEVYDCVKTKYVGNYSSEVKFKLVSLAKEYPPRVRKVLSDMLFDLNEVRLSKDLISSVLPTTRFELNYLPISKNEAAYR